MAYANGQTRAWANNSTASAAATLVNKRYTFAALLAALQAATAATAANLTTGTLGNMLRKHMMTGAGQRMFEASFFGVGNAATAGTCKVWFTKWDGNDAGDVELFLHGTASFALSTATGTGTDTTLNKVLSTEKIADTLSYSQTTFADTLATTMGSTPFQVYNAVAVTANTQARIWFPDTGNYGVLLEPLIGTATSVNALVESGT